jgi:Bacterial regulatory helix-turn-helix protein, lysR family
MKEVAMSYNMTTSTVSPQIAALAKDAGVQLIEPEGRRVRLTPAGRRLAEHAVTGGHREHTPDFFVRSAAGAARVVDVRPVDLIDSIDQEKFDVAYQLSGKPQGLVVGSRRRLDQITANNRESLLAAVASLKCLVGLAAVPGDDEHEAVWILDTFEHFDVVAAAIAGKEFRECMSFVDEGCPLRALHLQQADFVNAHRLSFRFIGLGVSRGGYGLRRVHWVDW